LNSSEIGGWTPLYGRASEAGAAEFVRLYPGVPRWMRESLWEWLAAHISSFQYRSGEGYWDPSPAQIREIERICRIDIGWPGGSNYSDRLVGASSLRVALYENDIAFLTAVDLHLSRVTDHGDSQVLEQTLSEAASEWRVGELNFKPALVKRIDDTVQHAAEELARKGTRPGSLLADGWRHAFSMQRDPSASYRCSVRAVEAAAGPILTPADPRPSLGKMIPALRDGMGKWTFAFTVDSAVEPKNVLMQMMQLLWTNEYSRHVDTDPMTPLHVSQAEAESAVVLALTLVNWFTSGALTTA
jgi:hypothetical protein